MVSATSLNNLIPMPSKWGVATKAIRVPINLVEEFLEMANNWAQKFREEMAIKGPDFQLGKIVESPADLTYEEWEEAWVEAAELAAEQVKAQKAETSTTTDEMTDDEYWEALELDNNRLLDEIEARENAEKAIELQTEGMAFNGKIEVPSSPEIIEIYRQLERGQITQTLDIVERLLAAEANRRFDPFFGTPEWGLQYYHGHPNAPTARFKEWAKGLVEECAKGVRHEEAKKEVAILRGKGWPIYFREKKNKGFGNSKQQAKLAKRAANASKSGAKIV